MNKKDTLVQAINEKRLVLVEFDSNEKGIVKRICVPFDFWPSRKYKDWLDRFHFYDLDSPDDGKHNLSLLPEKIIDIHLKDETFDPGTYVKWTPKWIVSRDWGDFS